MPTFCAGYSLLCPPPETCCCTLLLGFKAPPPSRLIFLLARNLPKVWGHFLLHSSLPKVQVLYLPLLIPFFPLCPTPLHGRFIALSEVCGLLPCSVDILCESLLLVVYFLFSCEKVSSPCCFSAVFILSSVLAFLKGYFWRISTYL